MPTQLPALNVATAVPLPTPFIPLNYVHPGLSLTQLISILRAHWRRTVSIFIAVAVLVIGAALLMPRTYEATATLMVRYEVNDPLSGKEFPIGLLSGYIATQIELLRSPEVLLPVIDRLKLTAEKKYTQGFNGAPADLPTWILSRLLKKLTIEQGRFGSQLIHVTYAGTSPDEAALIANTIADIHVQLQNDRLSGPASDHARRYSEQLDDLRLKVERAQEQVTAFRDHKRLVDPTGNIDIEMEVLGTLEQRLLEAQNARRAAEARSVGDIRLGESVLESVLVQQLKTQLTTLTARRAELASTLGIRHPDMVALDAQIAQTRSSLDSEINTYSASASSELAATRALESKLRKAVDDQRARILDIRDQQDQAARYQIELASAQAVYKRALDGFDQASFASRNRYNNISVESRAVKPLRWSRPNLLKYTVFGIALGGILGVLSPLLLELLNRRVRCRDDLERDHGIPVLMEFTATPAPRLTA